MAATDNPLLKPSSLPFGMPDFASIKVEHFEPAIKTAMRAHRMTVHKVASNTAPATFENTIVPLELADGLLGRVTNAFGLVANTMATPQTQDIEERTDPAISTHYTQIAQRADVFARVKAVYDQRSNLTPVQARLVEEYHRGAVMSGIALPPEQQAAFTQTSAELTSVQTAFSRKFVNQIGKSCFVIENAADFDGTPEALKAKAAEAAAERAERDPSVKGKFVIPLIRNNVEEFLTHSPRRDLREAIYTQFANRNNNDDEFDTRELIPQAIALKQQKNQQLALGFPTYGHMIVANNMAKTPEAATELMQFMWDHGKPKFVEERDTLQKLAAADGINETLKPWDFDYYANKYKQQAFGLDDNEVKKYLKLENVQAALFDVAERLFGVTMTPRPDLKAHHPDAKVWEMKDEDGKHVAIFVDDLFARDGKQSGAWMSELRGAHGLNGGQSPIIYNVCNFSKPAKDEPALLSVQDAITLFHEFGHGLHGMLTTAKYPSLAGTRVQKDGVELPSQFMEHYLFVPEIMQKHLRHVDTNEPMPQDLAQRIKATSNFGEGRHLIRYAGSALIDLALHQHPGGAALDVRKFEAEQLVKLGMPEGGDLMHRLMHHSHSMSGYSGQYYVYGYAGIFDNAAFARFMEHGDPFHPPTAASLKTNIYQSGNTRPGDVNFSEFYGGPPSREPWVRMTVKGLAPA